MRLTAASLTIATAMLAACDSPPVQPQDTNVVDATRTDQAFPSQADGNDIITGSGTLTGPGSPPAGGGLDAAGQGGNQQGGGTQAANQQQDQPQGQQQ